MNVASSGLRPNGRKREPPIRVPQTPSAFHRRANETLSSSRWASTIQIVRHPESIGETEPPTPSGFAEIVNDDFPVLHHVAAPIRNLNPV